MQFKDVAEDALPRVYLAWPAEIAERLKAASGGRGDTILHEDYQRGPKAAGAGTRETLPEQWRLTPARVGEMLAAPVLTPS